MFVQRTRTLKLSLFAILSAFAVELVFGIFSNSLALLTDSIHALL
ncbi:MAG TPA: cation transporter, partial [Candidatus Nitrosotenuis sp.]